MSTCTCGARITWAVTGSGVPIPLDPATVLGGNIELLSDRGKWVAEVIKPDPKVHAYRSHFATCPNADKHRKKKEAP